MALTAYLKVTGTKTGLITGDCKQKGHEDWIHVYAVDHTIEVPYDKTSGDRTGRRFHGSFNITKGTDSATPQLYQICSSGENLPEVKLEYHRINDQGVEEVYFAVTCTNAQIVKITHSKLNTLDTSTKAYPDMEEVSFAYQTIQWDHIPGQKTATDSWLNFQQS